MNPKETPEDTIARMSPVAMQSLLRVWLNPGCWRVLPGAVRKKLRTENLVVQNRDDEWELTSLGHQVRKTLTKNTSKPIKTYGPTFKAPNHKEHANGN
ncbi:hypothetical protein M3G47_01365 [Corynebacterium sanguinis]|uniref:hypothetical protein n=1 Tax=Corynebacterium sanguinis TaxID=2594913 RepID=UPI0021A5ECB6|nr:hypothetical protein [Corynebacterium sanguinis]MCT1491332.1 hypothetical protein [Corynebacterium sanguinis]MCT2246749.1 hypothetical protein [Corynebacterium sanguinis]